MLTVDGMPNSTMQAAIIRELKKPLTLETIPVPEPGDGDVLIKVKACGVCHSDLHAADGDWTPLPNLPLIPGHEVTGTIAKLGSNVTGFAVGDRVGVAWLYSSCGHCEFCRGGMETICKSAEATGYSKPGGYADYMIARADFTARLPDAADDYEIAPILCAGVTTYRGIKRTNAKPGQWLAVIGVGGLGHIAIQYAKAMGLRVAAIDVAESKLKLARDMGAEVTVNAKERNPVEALQSEIDGAHAAIVTATSTQAFEQAAGMVRPAGTVVYIGLPGGAADTVRASILQIVNGEITIRGSNVGTRADLDEAVGFAARGLVKSHNSFAKLQDINTIFADMKAAKLTGRVVLKIS
jgi:alcohol dehydrogenase, propanol-preferring